MIAELDQWKMAGACVGASPDLWFHDDQRGVSYTEARDVCSGCEVATHCLEYALAHNIQHGMWGGTSPRQRRALAAARRRGGEQPQ